MKIIFTTSLFMGMEDKRLRDYYPCHTDMITYSLYAHKHNIPHFLEKLKKTIKTCEHWGLYKYLTCAMCKRCDDRMGPFAMNFDEMTDHDDFTTEISLPSTCSRSLNWFCFCWQIARHTLLPHCLN